MKDSVIKGNGNSRYLKSSLEGITTWEQFRAALAAGTLPVDLNGINPEGFQQLGDPFNKASLLKDSTAALLGLPKTAVPDDAFVALVLGQGVYGYRVRVQLADGSPVEGATVSGIQPLTGSTLVTGADGTVLGKSASASVTIGCTSPYIDQKAPAAQTVTKTGTITDVTLTLENVTDMLTISSSKTARISSMAKRIDIFASGGGGGGAAAISSVSRIGSGGGGGGYASNKLNEPISGYTDLKVIIGAGGIAGYSSNGNSGNGGKGGETTVSLNNITMLTASGGFGATGNTPGGGNGRGGYGSENGYGEQGVAASVYVFNDSSIGIKTGGGGGSGGTDSSLPRNGGSPNGGKSGYVEQMQGSEKHYSGAAGGVGGGGGGDYYGGVGGGAGGPGIVYLRFHFDAA